MAWHLIALTEELAVATQADARARHQVLAIAWDDQHPPEDNKPEEFRYLVILPGAERPSWILGSEVSGVYA